MTFISRHIYTLLAIATVAFLLPIIGIATAETAITSETNDTAFTEAAQKCQVCHNGRHPHTVNIACKAVQRHLDNHPGDYEGPCQGVTPEKPPKPGH